MPTEKLEADLKALEDHNEQLQTRLVELEFEAKQLKEDLENKTLGNNSRLAASIQHWLGMIAAMERAEEAYSKNKSEENEAAIRQFESLAGHAAKQLLIIAREWELSQ